MFGATIKVAEELTCLFWPFYPYFLPRARDMVSTGLVTTIYLKMDCCLVKICKILVRRAQESYGTILTIPLLRRMEEYAKVRHR